MRAIATAKRFECFWFWLRRILVYSEVTHSLLSDTRHVQSPLMRSASIARDVGVPMSVVRLDLLRQMQGQVSV
jgi:hypothetical protein